MQFGNYVHARSRTVWAAALIVGTLACGGDSVTSPSGGGGDGDGFNLPANPPLLGGNATTPTVSVVKESGSAAKASIGVDGGTIVAHGWHRRRSILRVHRHRLSRQAALGNKLEALWNRRGGSRGIVRACIAADHAGEAEGGLCDGA